MEKSNIRILVIDDNEDDADLLTLAIKSAGYKIFSKRVQTAFQLTESLLSDEPWDIALCDYTMPGFSGLDALKIVKTLRSDLPLIIVSGAVGEDITVKAMKAGAQDYIMKDNLLRLIPAVQRELLEAETREKHRQVQRELEEKENQLRQSQKIEAIGRLAGGIAHDFNNILGAIMINCDLILEQLKANGDDKSYVVSGISEILKSADFASTLTKQLLIFGRKQPYEPKVVSLTTIISELEKMLRRLIGENIALKFSLEPSPYEVCVDPGHVKQLVTNLVINSKDALVKGGHINVVLKNENIAVSKVVNTGTLAAGEYAALSVEDNGSGMDQEVVSKIFDPFYTTKAIGKGTGLGLSIVYGIVKQSGGQIEIKSSKGLGTTFKVFFPRSLQKNVPIEEEAVPNQKLDGTESILLVEDDEKLRAPLTRALSRRGYTVKEVSNAYDAIAYLRRSDTEVDLVITDVLMAGMTGVEFGKIIKTFLSTNVLYISGYPELAENISGEDKEMVSKNLLQKPFSEVTFLGKIRDILDS